MNYKPWFSIHRYHHVIHPLPSDCIPSFSCPLIHCLGAICPSLPPKPAYICSFEQQIADKEHKDLFLRENPSAPNTAPFPLAQRSTSTILEPPLRVRFASALAKSDLGLSLPLELVSNDVIVKWRNTRSKYYRTMKQNLELTIQNRSSLGEKVSTLVNRIL